MLPDIRHRRRQFVAFIQKNIIRKIQRFDFTEDEFAVYEFG